MNPTTIRFQPGERNVFLHLLTACNLQCKHCYINKEQHGSRQLTKEEIEAWIKIFADRNKKTNIIFLGGEPTLHSYLSSAITLAKESGYITTVDSNGCFSFKLLDKINPEQLDYFSFSLDGASPVLNDPIRGKGVFTACTENIQQAIARGFQVSVIYTVSKKNIAELYRMGDLLENLGVKKFFIQVIGLRGKSAKFNSDETSQVSRKEWLDIVPKAAAEIAMRGIHVTYPKVFLDKGEPFECAGNVSENYFIFPNGRVYQCPLCEDHSIHSFKIIDNKLVKIEGLREDNFFKLDIKEGCVMNKLLQPDTIEYDENRIPLYQISCCMLKQEISGIL